MKAQNTIEVHPNNRVASLQMSSSDYEAWKSEDQFSYNNAKLQEITQELYQEFDDEFDFIFFVLNEQTAPENIGYSGKFRDVSNDIEGLGKSIFDDSSEYGSNGKLQGVIQFAKKNGILSGPALHELMHNWGNFVIETSFPGHWGFTGGNSSGQLGGFEQSTLVDNGNNNYSVDSFGENANGGNSVKYSNLELYLMGLISASEVEDFDVFNDLSNVSYDANTQKVSFTSSNKTTHNGISVANENGARIPNYENSQKEFRILTVVLTDTPLTDEEWFTFDYQITKFALNGDDGNDVTYNFWEATDGKASLSVDNISSSMEAQLDIVLEKVEDNNLIGLYENTISSADIDGDNDLDLFISGNDENWQSHSKIYLNDGNANFTETTSSITNLRLSSSSFGDYDGDDDQDLIITGLGGSSGNTILYQNDGNGNFSEVTGTPFQDIYSGTVKFIDIDGDEDLDIMLSGKQNYDVFTTKIYRNDGSGNYSEIMNTNLMNVFDSDFEFSDFDGDNDIDILMKGKTNNDGDIDIKLYINNGDETFSETSFNIEFTTIKEANIAIGNLVGEESDDLIITALSDENVSKLFLYENDGNGNFSLNQDSSISDSKAKIEVGDFNNNGNLEILFMGYYVTPSNGYQYAINEFYTKINGKYYNAPNVQLDYVSNANFLHIADFDGNFQNDIIITGYDWEQQPGGNYSRVGKIEVFKNTTEIPPHEYTLEDITSECTYEYTTPPTITTLLGEELTGTTTNSTSFSMLGENEIQWNFEESNGNIIEIIQKIILTDTTAPSTITLSDIIADCSITVTDIPTTLDDCSGTITATTDDTLEFNESGSINWIFTDDNGNSTQATQQVIINIEEMVAPTLADLQADCSLTVIEHPTLDTDCFGTITATTEDSLEFNQSGIITWTFDNGNGETVQATQQVIINVEEMVAPTLADLQADCSLTVTEHPTLDTDCFGTITATTEDSLEFNQSGTITWTFDNGNGETVQATQQVIINVEEMVAPTLADLQADCSLTVIEHPTLDTDCFGTITATTEDSLEFNQSGTITWTFDNGNGETVQATQQVIINVEEMVAPTLADLQADCSLTVTEHPTLDTDCFGTITATTEDSLEFNQSGTITWTFDNGNGETVQATQQVIINVEEMVAPTLADLQADCSLTVTEHPTLDTDCFGTITATTEDSLEFNQSGIITWTFDNGNGETVQATQQVNIEDNVAPEVPELETLTGNCAFEIPYPSTNDNCSGEIIGTTEDNLVFNQVGEYTINWSFQDENGNITTTIQNVIIEDIDGPNAPVIEDVYAQCEVEITTIPSAVDFCSDLVTVTHNQDDLIFDTQGIHIITWSFEDESGNISTATQTIYIEDTEAPTFEHSILNSTFDLVTNCETVLEDFTNIMDFEESDNCSSEIIISQNPSPGTIITETTTIEISFTDEKGNTSSFNFDFEIIDTEAPEITCPETKNILVDENTTYTLEDFTSELNILNGCGEEIVTQSPEATTELEIGAHTISFTIEDSFGNQNTCEFILNVVTDLSITDESISKINIFPNPANDYILIQSDLEVENIFIYDMTGKIVLKQKLKTDHKVDLDGISKGVYYVNVIAKNKKFKTEKLIIK